MKAWTCVLVFGLSSIFCAGQERQPAPSRSEPYVPRGITGGIPKGTDIGGSRLEASALEVTITPDSARAAGAKWRLAGTEQFRESGERLTVKPGTYTINFSKADGFVKPSPVTVQVQGERTSAVGRYEKAGEEAREEKKKKRK